MNLKSGRAPETVMYFFPFYFFFFYSLVNITREIYINHKLEQCHENLFALNGAVEHEWWAFPNFTLFGNKYGFSIFNENLFIPGRVHDATEITTDKCLDDN